MNHNGFHDKEFAESTRTKLELYRGYLRGWLPGFMNNPNMFTTIQVYDFFSGPGTDSDGNDGSPMIAIKEILSALEMNKERLSRNLRIRLILNDNDRQKSERLREIVSPYTFGNVNVSVEVVNQDFLNLYEKEKVKMRRSGTANLVFIDQFGISEVTKNIFSDLASISSTDIIFFTSSAIINRMKEHPAITPYIPSLSKEELDEMNGRNVHRILSRSYRKWLPAKSGYFLGDFSLKYNANVYGLVFGSGHILGILKFLGVAWKLSCTGDANYDIDGDNIDEQRPSLFSEFDRPTKIKDFEFQVRKGILEKHFRTNYDILRFAAENGMLPQHAKEAFDSAVKEGKLPKQSLGRFGECWKKDNLQELDYGRGAQ
jgi:three-Cys-motif partner protein